MQFDHINIKAPRELIEQEKRFLCRYLSLTVGLRPSFSSQGYWLYSGEQAVVHLSVYDDFVGGDKTGHLDHVAFRVTNGEQLLSSLQEEQIRHSVQQVPGSKITQVFFRTPTGLKLEASFTAAR